MQSSHHADGPDSLVLSGPGDHRAKPANDNLTRFPAALEGVYGLALITEFAPEGTPVVTIRGLDAEGGLLPPLHIARDPSDIVALWRGLGRDLNLPLYLPDDAGVMTPVTPLAGEIVHARRKGSPLSGRRPRFLTRRKVPANPVPAGSAKVVRKG